MRSWRQIVFVLISALAVTSARAEIVSEETAIRYSHGYAFLREPAYPVTATHFDYVNPDAPKGGTLRLSEMGNWDSLNPVAIGGRLAVGVFYWVKDWRFLWDTLLRESMDEPSSHYGLIAEGVRYDPEQGAWVAFLLNENARFHDGQPITVEDVVYTFEVSTTIASPDITEPMKLFSHIEVIGEREVKFHIHEPYWGNPVLPIRAGNMPIFPKHYWQDRDITKTTVEPPLGSGPYRIGRFSVGRWIEWERVEDYWAQDLPVNRGHWNFDTVRYEYFRNDQVRTEAVKAHVIDAHIESVPRAWKYAYRSPALEQGWLKKRRYSLRRPGGLWWPMFFNLDQPRFRDIRVREALWLLSNYEWGGKRSDYFYKPGNSFFAGSELASSGLPGPLELQLLEPLRELVPPDVFTKVYQPPPGTPDGVPRENLVRAQRLLEEAGWVVRDQQLVNAESGEPFELRFLAVSEALGRGWIPYSQLARRLGIRTSISAPEVSNWQFRIRTGDFDIGGIWFLPEIPPTNLVRNQFHSSAADLDYSYNWSNMRDPAVDALINAVGAAATWEEFIAACRALDRVLLWNFYFFPTSSRQEYAGLYWDKFGRPPDVPLVRPSTVQTWWWDENRAKRVAEFVGDH